MRTFVAILAAYQAAHAEDLVEINEENRAQENFLLPHIHPVVTTPEPDDHLVVPPYPTPVHPHSKGKNSAVVELIQTMNTHPVEAVIRTKTKSKGGPAIPYERSPLECKCPDTFTLFGDKCERIIEKPQETLCPGGTELLNNICVRTVRPEEHCPYNFATINNRCIRREVSIPRMKCADGYTLEASAGLTKFDPALVCVKQFAVDNILECPDGSRYNGSCFLFENVPAEYTCPAGYEDIGKASCRRLATVPCSAEHPDHKSKGLGASNLIHRRLSEEESMVMTRIPVQHDSPLKSVPLPGTLRGKSELAGYHKWHQGGSKDHGSNFEIIDIEQTCVANITIPATPYCPIGELHGRLCQVPIPTNPIEICPAYGHPSNCFAFDRLTPFATCPDGYKQECAVLKHHIDNYVDCECVKVHERDIDLFCPAGYVLEAGMCVLRTEAYTGCSGLGRPVNGACQRTETTPAVCAYTVSYSCEGPSCSTAQHGHSKLDHPASNVSIKKF